jgi:hypothetical protein
MKKPVRITRDNFLIYWPRVRADIMADILDKKELTRLLAEAVCVIAREAENRSYWQKFSHDFQRASERYFGVVK